MHTTISSEITQGDAKNMYITYGGYSEAEAGEKVAVLVFVKQHPEADGISYAGVEAYQTYCESRGVPAGPFYDVWKMQMWTQTVKAYPEVRRLRSWLISTART